MNPNLCGYELVKLGEIDKSISISRMNTNSVSSIDSLQEILTIFGSDWPDLMKEDCNPLDIALPLSDSKSILTYNDFRDLKKQFTRYLQKAVNENYMTFNDSIGSYGISIETLNQSQDKLTNIRKDLGNVDQLINSRSNILGELNEKRMEHAQILNILEKIDELQKKLNALQGCIENPNFEKGVNLVEEITEIANDNKIFTIDGLQPLQTRLTSYVSLLSDGLVNEIENNIYLKNSSDNNKSSNSLSSSRIPLNEGLFSFIKKLNGEFIDEDKEMEIQNGRYDELLKDFKYIQKINKESECLIKLVEKSEREIKNIIKRSVNEIRSKYPSQIEMNLSSEMADNKNDPFSSFNLLQGMNGLIIKEVFGNIFSKLLVIFQRHMAIYEISKFDGYKYRIDRVWKEIQKQLSLVIFNYIIDENLLNNLEQLDLKLSSENNISPFSKIPKQFEINENGPVFQFSKLSLSMLSKDLIGSLNKIFINESKGIVLSEVNVSEISIYIGVDDINENKKNVLVPPNIFNMAYIIDEFINFTNEMTGIYSRYDKNETINFFNQFMDIIFVSQLENTLIYQFDKLCEGKWKQNQLLDASISIKQFFNKVLIILDTSIYYRPSYVEIIFKLFDRMNRKLKETKEILLKTNKSQLLKKWINDSKLKMISNDIVKNLLYKKDFEKLDLLHSNELTYALSIGGNLIPNINPKDFLTLEHMRSLVDLLASLSNILNWLPNVKRKVPELFEDVNLMQQLSETWTLNVFNDSEFPLSYINLSNDINDNGTNNEVSEFSDGNGNIYNSSLDYKGFLSIDNKSEVEFDKLVEKLKNLMNEVEILIRYEIRVECIWCMIQMMINKQWINNGDESVDLGVDRFCERINDINRIFNRVSKNTIAKSKSDVKIRIFGGLGFWIDKLAVFESRRIEVMGKSGWMKMIVNLRVLQQVIKGIDNDMELNHVNGFKDMSTHGPSVMNNSLRYFTIGTEGDSFILKVENVQEEGLNLGEEDWKNLIRLIFSERMSKDSVGNVKKKYMAAQARLLKGLAMK